MATKLGGALDKRTVAYMLGVNIKTVERWEKQTVDPLPIAVIGGLGVPHQYAFLPLVEWRVRRELATPSTSPGEPEYDYFEERARLTHEQADKVAMEVEQIKGEAIPASDVQAHWQGLIGAARAKLLSLPTRTAHLILGALDHSEVVDIITLVIWEALEELDTDGLPAPAREKNKKPVPGSAEQPAATAV